MNENIDFLKKLRKKTSLMQEFPKYINKNLNLFSKDKKTKITIRLSTYLACKLENFTVKNGISINNLIKKFLITKGILNEKDIKITNRAKLSGFYIGRNCNELKNSGGYRTYNITINEYAKAKFYKYLFDNDYSELNFFFVKNLTKGLAPEGFEIFDPKDIIY